VPILRDDQISYAGYHFAPEIIQQAIWLCVRFTMSFRDVEDLLVERGIAVSYEIVRRWVSTAERFPAGGAEQKQASWA
jgi:transposase-like protein